MPEKLSPVALSSSQEAGKKPSGQATAQATVEENKQVIAEHVDTDTVDVPEGDEEHAGVYAQVGVDIGATIPIKPYTTIRGSVMIVIPCAPDNIDAAYEFCDEWANAKLSGTIAAVKKQIT